MIDFNGSRYGDTTHSGSPTSGRIGVNIRKNKKNCFHHGGTETQNFLYLYGMTFLNSVPLSLCGES